MIRLFLLSLCLALALPAAADLDPALKDAGWDEITFDDKPSNQFVLGESRRTDLQGGVRVLSDSTVSIAFFNVTADLNQTPLLKWQWRVDTPIIDTDLTKKGGDDRSMVIYVAFPYQPEAANFAEKIKRKAIEALKGKDTPGRVLTYVWGGGAAKGDFVENPYTEKYGALVYLRTADDPQGVWLQEEVNLKADFIKAFGYEPASPVYIGIGADSDDTGSTVDASAQGFVFAKDQ
jgi:hypothetical protein